MEPGKRTEPILSNGNTQISRGPSKGACIPRHSLRKKARWEERKGMDEFLTFPSRLPFFCFQSERGFIENGV